VVGDQGRSGVGVIATSVFGIVKQFKVASWRQLEGAGKGAHGPGKATQLSDEQLDDSVADARRQEQAGVAVESSYHVGLHLLEIVRVRVATEKVLDGLLEGVWTLMRRS
jgi:hypothetical protein